MKRKLVFILLVCFFCFRAFSAEEIIIGAYKCTDVIPVFVPVLIDSTNIKNVIYSDRELLNTNVDFEQVLNSKNYLQADPGGITPLPYFNGDPANPRQNKGIQLLSFTIESEKYNRLRLAVTSTEMFEVYINGEKGKTKFTRENSISASPAVVIDLALEPAFYEVVIKRVVSYRNLNEPAIYSRLYKTDNSAVSGVNIITGKKRKITVYDLLDGRRLTSAAISPGGKYFTAFYTKVDEEGKRSSEFELRKMDNTFVYRFPVNTRPYWMPSTDRIIYYRQGNKEKNLYVFNPSTLEEEQIAEEIPFEFFKVSPDEKTILLGVDESIPDDQSPFFRHLSPSDRVGTYRKKHSLFRYDIAQKKYERLLYGRTNMYICDISRDSRKVMFMVTEEDLAERLFMKYNLFSMDLVTSSIDTLVQDRFISDAVFSPDSRKILVTGSGEAFSGAGLISAESIHSNYYDNRGYIMNLSDRSVTPFTRDFNPAIQKAFWSPYDNRIYLHTMDEDREQIYSYDEKTGKFEKLQLKEDVIDDFTLAKNNMALYRGESVSNFSRLYSFDLKSKKTNLLSDPNEAILRDIRLGEVHDWEFMSSGGTTIKGRYYLPPDFDASKKYPVIVYYYGGINPVLRNFGGRFPLHVLAGQGYIVYTLNPSGTIGFGQEFSFRHLYAWGEPAADEIIEGIKKFCETHSFVDPDRIACIGGSYGGFMTQYLLTKTGIFAAAVSHAGISSLAGYWGEGYWGYLYGETAAPGSYPWNNPELYTSQSPLFHADKINTPLLLLHGENDTNVPIGESIRMFNALKIAGKTVEFIEIKGEGHNINDYRKRIRWNKTIFAWLARWLKDEPEWWTSLYPA